MTRNAQGAVVARNLTIQRTEESVLDKSYDRIERIFKTVDHVAVSFSGGKDSTVVFQLTLEVARRLNRLPLRVIFYDEEAIPYETEDYVRRVMRDHAHEIELEWYALPVKHRNACSNEAPWWWPWSREAGEAGLWCRPLPPEAITELNGFPLDPPEARLSMPDATPLHYPPDQYGTSAHVMGIRADESMRRRQAVSKRTDGENNFMVPLNRWTRYTTLGNVYTAYPIYDWKTEDVWTAPALFGWDTNEAYNLLEAAGLSHGRQRCAPPFGEEPMQGLWTFKVCFPDLWDKMVHRVPGAATAARYARTELYAFGKLPMLPEGGWQHFIREAITNTFEPEDQAIVAHRIVSLVERHYKRTTDPILPTAPHPDTGISWRWLAAIAVRGDFKRRRQPIMFQPGSENNLKMWDRYNRERKSLKL